MRFRWLGAAATLSILITSVSAGCSQSAPKNTAPEEPSSATTQAVQGGAADGTAHPYAVGVCNGNKGQCQGFCSGTLILPNLVVTARHCVDPTPNKEVDCSLNEQFRVDLRHTTMWITTNNTMGTPSSPLWHRVKSVVTPADAHICGQDIALLILDDQVAGTEAKPAIPGVQYPMGDTDRYVHRFTAIGYGNIGPEGFGGVGTRRIRASIPVLCIPGDDVIPCPANVQPNEFIGGDGTCSGDSGSSAFDDRTVLQDKPVSFGVLSRGGDDSVDGGPATLCKGSVYTRLDRWRDLVIDAAEKASADGTGAPWTLYPKPVPDWTVFVPIPDAGVVDAAPKPKTNLAEGVACTDNKECKSKVCADTGLGKACTTACDEASDPTECKEGFICKGAVCVQDLAPTPGSGGEPAAAAAPATTTTTGCSMVRTPNAPRPFHSGAALAIVGSAVALGLRRRRTRA